MTNPERPHGPAKWAILLLGLILGLLGLVIAAGGLWLLVLGGSAYYLLAGLGLIASGALLIWLRPAGVWVYWAVFVLTVVWALWEVGGDGWALVPRVFAPGILLVLVSLAALPLLRRRWAWALAPGAAAFLVLFFAVAGLTGHENAVPPQSAPGAQAITVSDTEAPNTSQPPVGQDWPAYAGTHAARGYSPLDQINRDNVGKLQRVWRYETGDLPEESGPGDYSPETTPIKVGDQIYLCSAMNQIIALHAGSGRERWRYDPGVPEDAVPYGASCRGVSYYRAPSIAPQDPCAERIIEGTLDARLIAVDAATGQPCADFGNAGQVNLREGIGDNAPGQYSLTSPPPIIRGVIVVGAQVLDNERRDAPSGVIRGYDAVTGELLWAWDMLRPDIGGLPPEGEAYSRGTPNMWTIAAGDEALGQVYLPMGNSAVDYYGASRTPTENEYSTALVALDVATGEPVWRFQTVHYDVWDYDLGSQPTLVDFPVQGGSVPAIVLPSKQGEIYILDRRTGEPITPVEERPVPIGGVEPENLSRTQPFSGYATLRKPDLTERDMWGASPLDQLWCRIQFRQAHYEGIYTPPTLDRHYIQYPGYNGGSDWGGVAVEPRRGVIIANYNDMPNFNRLITREEANRRGWAPLDLPRGAKSGDPQFGAPYAIDVNAGWRVPQTGLLCKQPPYGGIRAIDLATGRTLWDHPFGDARRNGPFGIPSLLPIRIGTPNNGGPIVTAGGLLFIAATTDNVFRAIDIETGEILFEDELPAGGQANPITYESDGRQFVVIMAGGHHFMETPIGDDVIAYSLPPSELPESAGASPASAS